MITLGIDIGSSSIKVTLFDTELGKAIASTAFPANEMKIIAHQQGWAEQHPETWMNNLVLALTLLKNTHASALYQTAAIGISYQMHGLVTVDKSGKPLRDAIIWCDSRAVSAGNEAFNKLGESFCLGHLLNSPGNFTASKLGWLRINEPQLFDRIYKMMLPGDYIAFRLTNEIRTTASGLSEGIMWDYEQNGISSALLNHFGIAPDMIPELSDTFSVQGFLTAEMAALLGMKTNTPVTYRAGDQPNNALSLNVLKPGEVAATAGTSGVVYGVTESKTFDPQSRVNTFLHVNNTQDQPRLGVLLCLNSVGILNAWARQQLMAPGLSYDEMNSFAAKIPEGSDNLLVLPFGNGAERMLQNKNIGVSIHGLDLTSHNKSHVLRALQEGIAFAFNYGLEIMKPLGLNLRVIRAGKSNMFLSPVFAQTLANVSEASIELYNTDGAEGAARGAAIGAGIYNSPSEAFAGLKLLQTIEPNHHSAINQYYTKWKRVLKNVLPEK